MLLNLSDICMCKYFIFLCSTDNGFLTKPVRSYNSQKLTSDNASEISSDDEDENVIEAPQFD